MEKDKTRLKKYQAIFFSEIGFSKFVRESATFNKGLISLILVSLFLSIPAEISSFDLMISLSNFVKIIVLLFVLLLVVYLLIRILGSRIFFITFFSSVLYLLLLSLLFVSLPAFIVSHYIINLYLGIQSLSLVIFSLIPYYNFLIFGWGVERSSKLKGFKAWFIAIISMTLLFILYYLLQFITM